MTEKSSTEVHTTEKKPYTIEELKAAAASLARETRYTKLMLAFEAFARGDSKADIDSILKRTEYADSFMVFIYARAAKIRKDPSL